MFMIHEPHYPAKKGEELWLGDISYISQIGNDWSMIPFVEMKVESA